MYKIKVENHRGFLVQEYSAVGEPIVQTEYARESVTLTITPQKDKDGIYGRVYTDPFEGFSNEEIETVKGLIESEKLDRLVEQLKNGESHED